MAFNCDYVGEAEGPGHEFVKHYALDEDFWITDYLKAWQIATENNLKYVQVDDATLETVHDEFVDKFDKRTELAGKVGMGNKVWYKKGWKLIDTYQLEDGDSGRIEELCLADEKTFSEQYWVDRGNGIHSDCESAKTWRAPRDDPVLVKEGEQFIEKYP